MPVARGNDRPHFLILALQNHSTVPQSFHLPMGGAGGRFEATTWKRRRPDTMLRLCVVTQRALARRQQQAWRSGVCGWSREGVTVWPWWPWFSPLSERGRGARMTRDIGHVISFLVGGRRTDQKANTQKIGGRRRGSVVPYACITVELKTAIACIHYNAGTDHRTQNI